MRVFLSAAITVDIVTMQRTHNRISRRVGMFDCRFWRDYRSEPNTRFIAVLIRRILYSPSMMIEKAVFGFVTLPDGRFSNPMTTRESRRQSFATCLYCTLTRKPSSSWVAVRYNAGCSPDNSNGFRLCESDTSPSVAGREKPSIRWRPDPPLMLAVSLYRDHRPAGTAADCRLKSPSERRDYASMR